MDVAAIQGAIASIKTATDIARSMLEVKTSVEIQSRVIEMQSALLSAQNSAISATTAQFELQERVRELERTLKEHQEWGAEKSRYVLVAPWRGAAQAYALKKSDSHGDSPHLLCANCFHKSVKSILNPVRKEGFINMTCVYCKTPMETRYREIGEPKFAEHYLERE